MTNAMPSLQMTIKLSYGWRGLPRPSFAEKQWKKVLDKRFFSAIISNALNVASQCGANDFQWSRSTGCMRECWNR